MIKQDDLTPETLTSRLRELFGEPARLVEAAGRARAFGIPDAAERLAAVVADVVPNGGSESVREAAA